MHHLNSRRSGSDVCCASSSAPRGGGSGPVQVHRGRLQQDQDLLGAGLSRPGGVREGRLVCGRCTPKGGEKGGDGFGVDSGSDGCVCEARARAVARQRRHALERLALVDGWPGRLRLRVRRLRMAARLEEAIRLRLVGVGRSIGNLCEPLTWGNANWSCVATRACPD